MAGHTGRNPVMSWIGIVLCAGVVGALVYLAFPMGPTLFDFAGDMLRAIAP